MNTENDLKSLWNKEKATRMPEAGALLNKAARLRRLFRIKLIFQTLILTVVLAIMAVVGLRFAHPDSTTIIGLTMMMAGILAYLVTTNQLLPMLYKKGMEADSRAYITQLVRIQRKSQFLHRVMIDIYFILLTIGLYLYLLQPARQLNTVKATLLYLLPSIGLAITWTYSKRREFNKIVGPLNDTIQQLELLNTQLHGDQ